MHSNEHYRYALLLLIIQNIHPSKVLSKVLSCVFYLFVAGVVDDLPASSVLKVGLMKTFFAIEWENLLQIVENQIRLNSAC